MDGIITTVAGTGAFRFSGDGGLATQAELTNINDAQVGPDGSLYIWGSNIRRVRKVASFLPGVTVDDFVVAAEDGSEVYVFNNSGRHLRTMNALTGSVRYQFGYDSVGRLISITDGDGNITSITRDASSGHPTALIAPRGQRTTLTVDANSYLATVTNPANERVQLSYTAEGLLVTQTDPKGSLSRYGYDALGRLIRDEDPAGGVQTLARVDTSTGHTVTRTTALGRTTTYQVEHLPTGALRHIDRDPNGTRTEVVRNPDGTQPVTYADGTRITASLGPDPRFGMQAPLANIVATTPGGLSFSATINRATTLVDPNNLLSLKNQTDTVTINGQVTTDLFDATQRRITTTTPVGRQLLTQLDSQGRVTNAQIAGIDPVAYGYDPQGRLTTVSQGQRKWTVAYNAQGLVASITDPLARAASFTYDLAGRVTRKILPDGRLIDVTYDHNGNLTTITPPGRPSHAFTATAVDLTESYTPPSVGSGSPATHYAYNLDRQLTQMTRPDGQAIALTYDSGGRMSLLTLPGGALTYRYSPTTGRLSTLTAPDGGMLSYSYDGPLPTDTAWTGAVSGSVGLAYDNNFRVTSLTVNGANSVSFAYDADGLLSTAGSLNLTHNAQNGLLTGTTLGGVTDIVSYTDLAELKDYSVAYSGSGMYSASYVQDAIGRIAQKTEALAGGTATYGYTYDAAGRLSGVTKNGTTATTYTYDSNGNRTGGTGPGGTVSGTYDTQDRLLAYGSATYSHTANGERLSKTAGGQITTYQYDALGNLLNVTLPNGTVIDYLIDGRNRRIGKKVNGALVQAFLYQGILRPIAEMDGTGNVVSRFVYATHINVPDYMIKGGVTYRIITDHLGSPRLVIDVATGTVAQRMDYDEFGNVTADTNPGFQPFGFVGGLYDRATKLVRFGARDYDPETGRWTAKDPILFEGGDANLYGYVLNNPVNITDIRGLLVGPIVSPIAPVAMAFMVGYRIGTVINYYAEDSIQDALASIQDALASGAGAQPDVIPTEGKDPESAQGLGMNNPGRNGNGNCNPCPPDQKWSHPGNAHGSTCGIHYHGIKWHQNPLTCECYPRRVSGPTPASLR